MEHLLTAGIALKWTEVDSQKFHARAATQRLTSRRLGTECAFGETIRPRLLGGPASC